MTDALRHENDGSHPIHPARWPIQPRPQELRRSQATSRQRTAAGVSLCSAAWPGQRKKPAYLFTGQPLFRTRASAAMVEGTVNSWRECVMAFIKRHRIAVLFVLAYALAWWATPLIDFFAPGVPLAALIMVMLTEGPSGLKASAGMPAWQRHLAITERKELR